MNQPPTTLELIIQETLRRRAAGERLKDNAVIAAHPELMPLLEIELKKLRLIAGARAEAGAVDSVLRRRFARPTAAGTIQPGEDLSSMVEQLSGSTLRC